VKTRSDLVVMPRGARIFASIRSPCVHTPQKSWCAFTAKSFHTAWVRSGSADHVGGLTRVWQVPVNKRTSGHERRKAGIRCLTVEMSDADLASLAKLPPQADPAVERTIGAVLNAAYGTNGRDREHFAASSEAPGDVCALCGGPGVLWHGLLPCSRGGKTFLAHPRCFEASSR